MSFSDLGSAIDDTFSPLFLPANPEPVAEENQSHYNAPRSGHWSVTSGIGSAIDDRCPTAWGHTVAVPDSAAGPIATREPRRTQVQPIAGNLLRKLAKATSEQRRAEEAEVVATCEPVTGHEQSQQATEPEVRREKQAVPKGFYLPLAMDMPDKNNCVGDGGYEVVRAPPMTPKSKQKNNEVPKASAVDKQTVSATGSGKAKMIRIRGKDVREVFVELSDLPKPVSRPAPIPAKEHTMKTVVDAQSPSRNQVEVVKSGVEVQLEQKAAAVKLASNVQMPSTSPTSTKKEAAAKMSSQSSSAQTVPVTPGKSSIKSFTVGAEHLFEAAATVASARSSKISSAKSLHDAVKAINENSTNSKSTNQVGGTQAGSPEHAFGSGVGFREAKAVSPHAINNANQRHTPSQAQARSNSMKKERSSDHRPATVFAGRGWISPHPLSCSSSELASPPQSHIRLPKDDFQGGATLTYGDWKAMQQHNTAQPNYSRPDSVISHYAKVVAASLASGGARASAVSMRKYRSATVESEHEAQRAGSGKSGHQSASSRRKDGSNDANGWAALPQFDSPARPDNSPSAEVSAAYEKQLQDIIAHYVPQVAPHEQPPSNPEMREDVRLQMPWDEQASPSVESAGAFDPDFGGDSTPPSAFSNVESPGREAGSKQAYTRQIRTPVIDAPSPLRYYDTAGLEHAAPCYEEEFRLLSMYGGESSHGHSQSEGADWERGGN